MVRYARQLVQEGRIGSLRLVQVEYIQAAWPRVWRTGRRTTGSAGSWTRAQRPRPGHERHRLPRAAPGLVRHGREIGRVMADVGTSASGTQGRRLRVGPDHFDGRHARHVHRHPGRRRRRERHPAARLRRQGDARVVAPRPFVPARRDAGRARCRWSRAPIRSFRRPSSRSAARRAATRKGCARRSRTSMARWRRIASRAISARAAGAALPSHRGRRAHDGLHRGRASAPARAGRWEEVASLAVSAR
jgi:hypothetical protein